MITSRARESKRNLPGLNLILENMGEDPINLRPGQVMFRLLCNFYTAGGVIGHSGSIIRRIEAETGAMIRLESKIHNCHSRLINVVGSKTINRKMRFEGFSGEWMVSQAQEALMRVFERVLEVEGVSLGVTGCRLLGNSTDVGAVMGFAGQIVANIRKTTGARVRILPKKQLPACASPADEVIQIVGKVMAVKRALLTVTDRIQSNKSQRNKAQSVNKSELLSQSDESSPKSATGGEKRGRKVEFRLLLSVYTAGGVIGKNAFFVKALEKETGTCVNVLPSIPWFKERIATISAFESPGSLYSAAQIATVRVFDRSIDISVELGHISLTENRGPVKVRLLLSSDEVACLRDLDNKAARYKNLASNIKIQLLPGDIALHRATDFDKVLQIIGEYENVKSALFQITSKIRDYMFSVHEEMTLLRELDFLGFLDEGECNLIF